MLLHLCCEVNCLYQIYDINKRNVHKRSLRERSYEDRAKEKKSKKDKQGVPNLRQASK